MITLDISDKYLSLMEVICIWYDGEVGICDEEDQKTLKALAQNEANEEEEKLDQFFKESSDNFEGKKAKSL